MRIAVAKILFFLGIFCLGSPIRTWGDPPVNTAVGTSSISLNFANAGTRQQIALFVINSNDPAGFHVTFSFQNLGVFKSGLHSITPTSFYLNQVSGTLGGNLVVPLNLAFTPDGSGNWTWNPGPLAPTSDTDNYMVEITASWAEPVRPIAGFYQEKISVAITSGF